MILCLNQVLSTTSPVFMWSNTKAFKGHNLQEVNILSANDIVQGLQHKNSQISKYITPTSEKPELIVIFVEPKISTEQIPVLAHSYQSKPNGGAFSNLKKHVESAESSLTVPYTTSSEDVTVSTEIVNSFISQLPKGAQVHLYGDNIQSISQVNKLPVDQPINVNSLNGALNNGVTDILVINFNAPSIKHLNDESSVHAKYAADDAILGEIMGQIQTVNYFAIFTSNTGTPLVKVVSEPQDNEHIVHQLNQFALNYGQNGDILYTTYWPAGIIEALLIMAPFLGILLIGVCCTLQLQSDLKFDAEKTILRNAAVAK